MPEPVHPIARLAWEAVKTYVERGEVIKPPSEKPPELAEPGGVFVSIKKRGELRGCIGTIESERGSRAEELIKNAVHAASMDPRFPPVEVSELEELEVSVDLLGPAEEVEDPSSIDPIRNGIIVSGAGGRALLLPDIEGVDTAERQLAVALRKAGLKPEEPFKLERFETKRYR